VAIKRIDHTVVIGLQWGDEGKGKFIDFLANQFDGTVRFNGGNNAGHSVKVGQTTLHFSLIPSAILRKKPVYISQAVVINPKILTKEIKMIQKLGIKPKLKLDPRCHVVMPYHQLLDTASEISKGAGKTGSLKLGIGFCYEDRTNRAGVRLNDLTVPKILRQRLEAVWQLKKLRVTKTYNQPFALDLEKTFKRMRRYGKLLKPYIFPVSEYLQQNLAQKSFLFESAQGTYLDFVFGSYPYTVAYHTLASSALPDCGLPPIHLDVLGLVKAYVTRVGGGPFPTELNNKIGAFLQQRGHEFGTVSGRPRRCGWLDLVLIKNACNLNGVNQLILTKLDVLSGLESIKIATGYSLKRKKITTPPANENDWSKIKPHYLTLPGWQEDISHIKQFHLLPKNCQQFVNKIKSILQIPIKYISVGPDRKQTIILN